MQPSIVGLCPGQVLDADSLRNELRGVRLDEELHREIFSSEGQQALTKATSVGLSSPDWADQKDFHGPAVSSQHFGTETAKYAKRETRTPPASPGKRRRSNGPSGPTAPVPRRRSSVPVRRKGQDLISFHQQSCQLFQSLEGTLALNHEWNITDQPCPRYGSTPGTRPPSSCIIRTDNGFAYLASTTSTPRFESARSSRRNSSAVVTSIPCLHVRSSQTTATTTSSSSSILAGILSSTLEEKLISPLASLPRRPHPVSVMSWTSTESRRREYEKIDRSHSGFRGLWKKITPRCCHGTCERKGFFLGKKDSEADSVRRYRIHLDDEDEDDDDEKNAGSDYGANDGGERKKEKYNKKKKKDRQWNCLPLLR